MRNLFLVFFSLYFCCGHAEELSERLDRIVPIFFPKNIAQCNKNLQPYNSSLASLGKILFDSIELSGDYDTSCSSCHLEEFGLSDGLPIAVGVGGDGAGIDRISHGGGAIVPRNAFTLVGRASNDFVSYFWDGRIALEDSRTVSPFGSDNVEKFDSLLSIAAVQPLLARDEFLGKSGALVSSKFSEKADRKYYDERYAAVSEFIRQRIISGDTDRLKDIRKNYVELGVDLEKLELSHVGNALSAFIASDFSCRESVWNNYLLGDSDALSEDEIRGALLFFGKGRCAACHSGVLFSDFRSHSIGVPQGSLGVDILGADFGRAGATNEVEDLYLFRTPPLLNVGKTAPYGHSGVFKDLEEVVIFHFNPIVFMSSYRWSSEREMLAYGKILMKRDPLLAFSDVFSKDEVSAIVSFLKTL